MFRLSISNYRDSNRLIFPTYHDEVEHNSADQSHNDHDNVDNGKNEDAGAMIFHDFVQFGVRSID